MDTVVDVLCTSVFSFCLAARRCSISELLAGDVKCVGDGDQV